MKRAHKQDIVHQQWWTFLTKTLVWRENRHQSTHMHADSNHKLALFIRHRASHISKVSLEHSIASPSARYMKENTVVSYNTPFSPFTGPNFKHGQNQVGSLSVSLWNGVSWKFKSEIIRRQQAHS